VGLVRPGFTLKPDPIEVDEIVELPLAELMDPRRHERHRTNFVGQGEGSVYAIHAQGQLVWGATASIVVDLYTRLTGAGDEGETQLSLACQDWFTDPATRAVMAALEAKGAPARFVGGCVRNSVLAEPVCDIDIATPEPPETVMALLAEAGLKAIPTGLAHGTVTAVAMGRTFEITTLRRDVETYGRHADVAFTSDFGEDAKRRDFTMNAIFADKTGVLYDYVNGMLDILTHRVRFIGDAQTRIKEDYLRILRFFRFYAWYGRGSPDANAMAAVAQLKQGLAALSAERVVHELIRLFEARDPARALDAMKESGVLAAILPEAEDVNRLKRLRLAETALGLAPDALLRLASILPARADLADALAARLKLSGEMRARLVTLTQSDAVPAELHAACYRLGFPLFRDRMLLGWARGNQGDFSPWASRIAEAEAWTIPSFPLSGADLRAHGVAQGPKLGQLLKALEEEWIAGDFKADHAALLARLDQLLKASSSN
jgi:poly(A) polymerase